MLGWNNAAVDMTGNAQLKAGEGFIQGCTGCPGALSLSLMCPWLLALVALSVITARAETPVAAWVQRYNGPGNSDDRPRAMAVTHSNEVVVAGYCYGSSTFNDCVTIKYSGTGQPLWTNQYNGTGNGGDRINALAVDGSNCVVVAGQSLGNGGGYDYIIIRYTSAGAALWTNRYNGPGNFDDAVTAAAVDSSNSVIVAGYSLGSGSTYDLAIIKYSSAGAALWTNRYPQAAASALAVDGSNNIVVAGRAWNSSSAWDYLAIKYSSLGAALWTNRYNGPGNGDDRAAAIAVNSSNAVAVTGYSTGASGNYDYTTLLYSSAGAGLWTNRYNGPANGEDAARALAVDSRNTVIVTGYSVGNDGSYDYATLCYSGAGAPLWTNRYSGPGNNVDVAAAVVVDAATNVIVTGSSYSSTNSSDYATIKYSADGMALWTNRYHGPMLSLDEAIAVGIDASNNVVVTGSSAGDGSSDDIVTLKYIFDVPSPIAAFEADVTQGVVPLAVGFTNGSTGATAYLWDFGDGQGDTNAQPAHVYTNSGVYSVTLSALGPGGTNTLTRTNYITAVAPPPVAAFAANPTSGLAPLIVSFTNFSIGASGYAWAFGDGSGSTNAQPTNTYASAGVYSVALTAIGPGGTNSLTRTNYITVLAPPPIASFTADVSSGVAPLPVAFANASTGATNYTWDFGNGAGSSETAPAYTYPRPGSFSVSLTAVGPGGTNMLTRTNYITAAMPIPSLTPLGLSGGNFLLRVDQVLPAGTLVLEESENLTNWGPVFTNLVPTNVVYYQESLSPGASQRYYRAVQTVLP